MAGPNFEASAPAPYDPSMNPGLVPQPQVPQKRKQRLNIYTVMLISSLIALIIGIVILYNLIQSFDELYLN